MDGLCSLVQNSVTEDGTTIDNGCLREDPTLPCFTSEFTTKPSSTTQPPEQLHTHDLYPPRRDRSDSHETCFCASGCGVLSFIPNYTDYGLTACLRLRPSSLTAGPDSRFLLLHGVIGPTLHVLDCILGFRVFGNSLSSFASYFTGVLISSFGF